MVILIAGASHTGKTVLAQHLLEKLHYPYLSMDHLKMGLIRSGQTELTPCDDEELTDYLWPIVREMIKTAIENKQNLIVEGCYIPFDWQKEFHEFYLEQIRYCCLIMSRSYIESHFEDIRQLLSVLNKLVDKGNTVIVIEHNLDVIKVADHIIDLGPEGGEAGGNIVAQGTPAEIAACAESYTGAFLKEKL